LAESNTVVAAKISNEMDRPLDCWADRQQIQTILTHLLENAMVATSATQGVVVIANQEIHSTDQEVLCFEIRDQGPGIPPDLREKVFTPFFSSRTDGTGLGLAIVRQIVENHHGRIEIDGNATYGCIIRVSLPLA